MVVDLSGQSGTTVIQIGSPQEDVSRANLRAAISAIPRKEWGSEFRLAHDVLDGSAGNFTPTLKKEWWTRFLCRDIPSESQGREK